MKLDEFQKTKLDVNEKNILRHRISDFVNNNPKVRNQLNNRHIYWRFPSLQLIFNSKPMIATLVAAVLIALSGGTAAAAENALPGDLLYPIKMSINEEVRSALTLSPEAKVNWDNRRAERRLEETEQLVSENKLTTSTAAMLAEKFKTFSDKANARLTDLQAKGKLTTEQVDQLKENFEVAVKAHDEVINRIQEREQDKAKLKEVVDTLREQASSTIRERIERELKLVEESNTTTLKVVAENRKNAANNKIAEVEKFITDNTEKVSAENVAQATKKLGEAKATITDGDKLYTEEKYGEAVIKYSEGHRQAQEAKKYMTGAFRLERKNEVPTSTPPTTTLQNIESKRQAIVEAREDLRQVEQKLREEVQQARDSFREIKNTEMERIRNTVRERIPTTTATTTAQ